MSIKSINVETKSGALDFKFLLLLRLLKFNSSTAIKNLFTTERGRERFNSSTVMVSIDSIQYKHLRGNWGMVYSCLNQQTSWPHAQWKEMFTISTGHVRGVALEIIILLKTYSGFNITIVSKQINSTSKDYYITTLS